MSTLDAVAADGSGLDLDGCDTTYTYNSDGTIATISVVSSGNTYVQTWTWTAGNLTNTSKWVKQ